MQSFVAETDGGSKGKKSSGDSKGSRTIASKVSSKEERKLSQPPQITQASFMHQKPNIKEDYISD